MTVKKKKEPESNYEEKIKSAKLSDILKNKWPGTLKI